MRGGFVLYEETPDQGLLNGIGDQGQCGDEMDTGPKALSTAELADSAMYLN